MTWIIKRDACYLDIDGHNVFEQRKAYRFAWRSDAEKWAKKWPCPEVNRVVKLVQRREEGRGTR